VKGEVKGCDIVAVRAGEGLTLTIVKMKLGFTLDLLLQVTDRMRAVDEVWLAVPATRRGRDRDLRVHRLCRLLGFGLMRGQCGFRFSGQLHSVRRGWGVLNTFGWSCTDEAFMIQNFQRSTFRAYRSGICPKL
jgi:hypothetical protein